MVEGSLLGGAEAGVALHRKGLSGHTAHTIIKHQPSAMIRKLSIRAHVFPECLSKSQPAIGGLHS